MPRIKIGEKVTASDSEVNKPKVFRNGHKFFTSAEASLLKDAQRKENLARENFELRGIENIKRDRNPLTGEATPRKDYFPNQSNLTYIPPRSSSSSRSSLHTSSSPSSLYNTSSLDTDRSTYSRSSTRPSTSASTSRSPFYSSITSSNTHTVSPSASYDVTGSLNYSNSISHRKLPPTITSPLRPYEVPSIISTGKSLTSSERKLNKYLNSQLLNHSLPSFQDNIQGELAYIQHKLSNYEEFNDLKNLRPY